MAVILVPDWDRINEPLHQVKRSDLYHLRGIILQFMERHDCNVMRFDEAGQGPTVVPDDLDDLPLQALHIHRLATRLNETVLTGAYQEDWVTAEVKRVGRSGQHGWIDVIGTNGTTLQELNAWYDALLAGDKASCRR